MAPPSATSTATTTSPTQNVKRSGSGSFRLESFSPEPTIRSVDYSSDIDAQDSGSASDSTVEDLDAVMNQYNFGYPLQRMPAIQRRSYGFAVNERLDDSGEEELDDGCYSEYSESECSTSSSISYDIDFEAVVDDLLTEAEFPKSRKFIMVEPSAPSAHDAFMIRPLAKHPPSPNDEYDILTAFNEHEARLDPWNPVPHVLSVVERSQPNGPGHACMFVCLEWLSRYDDPPFRTVANYIDFIRQTLEGLTFLHEHYVTCLNYRTTDSFMVDIGHRNTWLNSGAPFIPSSPSPDSSPHAGTSPSPPTPTQTQPAQDSSLTSSKLPNNQDSSPASAPSFDRTKYPVRYFYTDFSGARMFDGYNPAHKELYRSDVKDCGRVIESLLGEIPRVAPKMRALVNAMTSGTFGADDARKLFEALCKSLEASVFDTPVVPSGSKA